MRAIGYLFTARPWTIIYFMKNQSQNIYLKKYSSPSPGDLMVAPLRVNGSDHADSPVRWLDP